MDDALQRRLAGIERRQRYLLALLVYPYLAAGTWLALGGDGSAPGLVVSAVVPVVGLVVGAYSVALVRARGTDDGVDASVE
jgi:hypothetical protein